ncbi:MAG: class I SAM-dependent methyltransferase [Pseudomonadota bacterium]
MTTTMRRTPEPEKMTEEEETSYAGADYSIPHEKLAREIVSTAAGIGLRALDIGCGPGDVLIRVRSHAPSWYLYGVDMSPTMLSMASAAAQKRIPPEQRQINWVLGNVRGSGLPDDEFHVIMSNTVLHHIEDAVQFWREIARIARNGAHVFVRDFRRPPDEQAAREVMERNIGHESDGVKAHYFTSLLSSYTVAEVTTDMEKAGLKGLRAVEYEDRYLTVSGQVQK